MLTDVKFKNSYSSGYDEPREFFTEALIESKTFDLGLGFFSSSAIRSLAAGFAVFIANGGKMRIVINHILSAEDKEAIEKGQLKMVSHFEEKILTNIKQLSETFEKENEFFFKCLSYLIQIKRLDFVATVSTKGGLGHDKYGIFTDTVGNKVAFIGSANFSQTALELNGETITVFNDKKDHDRIEYYEKMFNESWSHDTPHLVHIPLNEVKTHIAGKFPAPTLEELIQNGVSMREIDSKSLGSVKVSHKPLPKSIVDKIEKMEHEPRFPFPEERDIQKNAYKAWIENDKKGLFAMATGAGKTVTALNCVLKQYQQNSIYKVIIAVPTQALAIQWKAAAASFNFQNIVCTHTDKDWKDTLQRYTSRSLLVPNMNIIIITTYATFNRDFFQNFISRTKGIESFVYIADEAHNVGSATSLKNLPEKIQNRIGLSATPERAYDDIGSSKIYKFFHSEPPKYTYRYTMKQAIDDKILCHYDYFPIFIELTEDEMAEYVKITNQLRKFIDPDTGKYKPEAENLLLKRKRIVHKAENKKVAIMSLLDGFDKKKKLDYTFVFVPEGYERDYSNNDAYGIESDDIHIMDEYAQMFKSRGYRYHKYISGIEDSEEILNSFARGDIQVLLSMKCLDEGVDIPRAEHAIFCSSTGNPRQFVQRRGRVLRKDKNKEKAKIWDLVVLPPDIKKDPNPADRGLFLGEVKRVLNFAALADNKIDILYTQLKDLCIDLNIDVFEMLEEEYKQYN